MSSPAKVPQAAPASSTTAAARVRAALPPHVDARVAAANDDAEAAPEDNESTPDPLWIIVFGMAVFFGITAVLLIAD